MEHPLSDMMEEIRKLIDDKGFSSDESRIWELFALLHTEVSEAVDIYRKGGSYEQVGYELTDTLIRLLHLMSVLGLDPDRLYQDVMEANRSRPTRWNTVRGG
jgi:NTP pyrophosphatase (non-canonical NTP hydrolase)